jgi:hypothetical protein
MDETVQYFVRPIVPENNEYYTYSDDSEYNQSEDNESKTNVTLHFKQDGTYDSEYTESDNIQNKYKNKNKNKKMSKIMKRGRPQGKHIKDTEEERRLRNRASAVMCRLRKKQRIEESNKYIKQLEDALNNANQDNEKIQKENEQLKKEIIELRISLETKNQVVNAFLQKGFKL